MRRGPAILTLLVAALLAVAAYFALRQPAAVAQTGALFVPGLESKAPSITTVEVMRGNATMRLERQADGSWVLASNDSYPAQTELVRGLIVSLGRLTLFEPMTVKRERHAELGLAWPDTESRACRVRLLTNEPGAEPVADVVLGDERAQPDTIYVRTFDAPETWRAKGRVQVQHDALGWVDRSLLALPQGETQTASLRGLTLSRPEGAPETGRPTPWTPTTAPDSGWSPHQIESAQLALPSFLERLEFEGVRRARPDAVADPAYSPSFEARGATIALHGRKDSDGVWFTLEIVPRPGAALQPNTQPAAPTPPDYAAVAARVGGWEYKMPGWKSGSLERTSAPDPVVTPPPGVPPGVFETPNK